MTIHITPLKIVVTLMMLIVLITVVPSAIDFFHDFDRMIDTRTTV